MTEKSYTSKISYKILELFTNNYNVFVFLMTGLASTFVFLQLDSIIKHKNVDTVSLESYIILLILSLFILIFGTVYRSIPLLVIGLANLVGSIACISYIMSYRNVSSTGAFLL